MNSQIFWDGEFNHYFFGRGDVIFEELNSMEYIDFGKFPWCFEDFPQCETTVNKL
ncbi:MAG: hypothetical protein F6K48_31415 [Okeania sp. SIO3H1]|nr:hypothetical protein [Okeania sp. SIO3H1]